MVTQCYQALVYNLVDCLEHYTAVEFFFPPRVTSFIWKGGVSGLSIPSCHTDHRIRSLGGNYRTTTIGNTSREFRLLPRSLFAIQPLNQTHQRIIFARIYLHHARHIRLV